MENALIHSTNSILVTVTLTSNHLSGGQLPLSRFPPPCPLPPFATSAQDLDIFSSLKPNQRPLNSIKQHRNQICRQNQTTTFC